MIYHEQLICSPFAMSQIGELQNEFLLFPQYHIQEKDTLLRVLFSEIDERRITDSFFRVVTFEKNVVIVHYWATTHKEVNSGRDGLFVVCGLIVQTDMFKKNISKVCTLASKYFQIIESYNQISKADNSINDIINDEISDDHCQKGSSHTLTTLKNVFEEKYYSDILWEQLQNNREEISNAILQRYEEACKLLEPENHIDKKSILYGVKTFSNNLKGKNILPREENKIGNCSNKTLIWLEDDLNENKISAFLQESCLILKKNKNVDVSSLFEVFPFSIRFLKDQSEVTFQLLFESTNIEKCNYDGISYIKFQSK